MSDYFICPYCDSTFALNFATYIEQTPSFYSEKGIKNYKHDSEFTISFYFCPKCKEYSVFARGTGKLVKTEAIPLKPNSTARKFSNYIPLAIREDYEEACAIMHLSPKASATLSRRCLQSMIHDFWNIHEKNLNAEITALKDKVTPTLWKALDGLRKIGNIGAHMEHDINLIIDVDPEEAQKLVKLIESLIKEWYVNRHEQEKLFSEITTIAEDKQQQRKSKK